MEGRDNKELPCACLDCFVFFCCCCCCCCFLLLVLKSTYTCVQACGSSVARKGIDLAQKRKRYPVFLLLLHIPFSLSLSLSLSLFWFFFFSFFFFPQAGCVAFGNGDAGPLYSRPRAHVELQHFGLRQTRGHCRRVWPGYCNSLISHATTGCFGFCFVLSS